MSFTCPTIPTATLLNTLNKLNKVKVSEWKAVIMLASKYAIYIIKVPLPPVG